MRRFTRAVLVIGVGVAFIAAAGPATAGGSWFDTDQPRYEAGDEVTVVGYTGGGQQGWIEDGPFHAWLTGNSGWTDEESAVDPAYLHYLGPITIHENTEGYPRLRLSITFTLPDDLVDGIYGFNYCNAACDEQIGDLIGGTIYIGDDTEGGREPQWTDWEPLRTGEPLPEHVSLVGTTPEPGFVPPDPSGVWWTGHLDSPDTTTTATSTTTTNTTTTVTTTTAGAPTVPPTTTGPQTPPVEGSSKLPGGSGIAIGALMVGALALAGVGISRRSDAG